MLSLTLRSEILIVLCALNPIMQTWATVIESLFSKVVIVIIV